MSTSPGARHICASCRLRLAAAAVAAPNSGRLQSVRHAQRRSIHQSTLDKRAEAERLWNVKAAGQKSGAQLSMLQVLESRGYIYQIAGTRSKTEEIMRDERIGVYVGIDPTAPSMHVGHLVPFMALFQMYAHGYHTYTLLGGATASVGDPTGRKTSRESTNPQRKHNITTMHLQLKQIWANVHHHLSSRRGVEFDVGSKRGLLNNSHWLNKLPLTEFLRKLGQFTRVGTMLGRETARFKMEQGDGLSFAEFTYPLLQGWDWWQLYKSLNVKLQIGGSDQLGNITAGKEALVEIAKQDHFEGGPDPRYATPIGFTTPLLTTASGAKFGKSEGNAIWLDPEMTSVFEQFQFFVRTADADLERYLKLFTFLSLEEIAGIMEANARDPGKRIAGKKLAEEVCLALHGETLTQSAMAEHAALFGGKPAHVAAQRHDPNQIEWEQKDSTGRAVRINPSVNKSAPQTNSSSGFEHGIVLPMHRVKDTPFPALFFWTSLVGSRSEGNRLIKSGGAYVGAKSSRDMMDELSYCKLKAGQGKGADYLVDDKLLILRIGKWKTRVITVVSDEEWAQGIKQAREVEAKQTSQGDSTEAEPATQSAVPNHLRPEVWLQLERRMQADDERWQREVGEFRQARNEEKRMLKELRQQAMLDDHAHALNPQRKDGRRAADPRAGAKAALVHDWDKKLAS